MIHFYCDGHVLIQILHFSSLDCWKHPRTKCILNHLYCVFYSLFPFNLKLVIILKSTWSYIKSHLSKWRSFPKKGATCKPCKIILSGVEHPSKGSHWTNSGPNGAPHFQNGAKTWSNPPVSSCVGAARVGFDGGHRRRHCRDLYKFEKYKAVRAKLEVGNANGRYRH